MATTIFQRVALWLSDYTAISDEWLKECFDAGARVVVPSLNSVAGQVPSIRVAAWKRMGYKVGGSVRPSHQPLGGDLWTPEQVVDFVNGEIVRLARAGASLNGILEFNFEEEVQQADLAGKEWSSRFCANWRKARPSFPSILNTFPCEGLNHAPYITAGFRGTFQTFSPTNLWEWAPTWYRNAHGTGWAQRVGWPKEKIKICWPVQSINGQRADLVQVGREGKESGVIGGTLFPTESAMPPENYVIPLIQTLISVGAAR